MQFPIYNSFIFLLIIDKNIYIFNVFFKVFYAFRVTTEGVSKLIPFVIYILLWSIEMLIRKKITVLTVV